MYTQQQIIDELNFQGHTIERAQVLSISQELKTQVNTSVQELLRDNYNIAPQIYNAYTVDQKIRVCKIVLFHICSSEYEYELLWESLNEGPLVSLLGEKEVYITGDFSYNDYINLLEALTFYECKKAIIIKKKYH